MISRISIALTLAVAGCAPGVNAPAAQIAKPRAELMVPPPNLPELAEGDDLFKSDGTCSAGYVLETGKLKGLQTYVRTIQKKQK